MNPSNKATGPYWPEPIRILSVAASPHGLVTIEATGFESRRHYTTILSDEQWAGVGVIELAPTFRANASEFALAVEAQRLRLAYTCDPLLAANNAIVHLLPHQIEAVYGAMLPQPRIRHLLAHDAGAGKTVMAGLLYKELRMREPGLRTLIIAPAALTPVWERELRERFLLEYEVVDRAKLDANPNIWVEKPLLITSMPFARQPDVRLSLASVSWDLVIVDEAHHLAAYEQHTTQAYRLGQILARQSRHLILATATPHKGDPHNFLRLLQLLDSGIHDVSVLQHGGAQRYGPLMSRRLKEEMVDFDGNPLFKARVVQTRWHRVGDNPPELELYNALTEYVHKTYRAAERVGGRTKVNVQFAMALLQRRMGSSFAALRSSLEKRRAHLLDMQGAGPDVASMAEAEDAAERERWQTEQDAELATAALKGRERRKEAEQIQALLEQLDVVRDSGCETKVAKLQEVIGEAGVTPGNGEKLLVFTEFRDTLDFLRDLFRRWGYSVTQIHGLMPQEQRLKAEAEFHDHVQVMVATEAAGEGINLQFCARMINYDIPWVPTRLEQRMGRIHRYGQTRDAYIYNMVAADTREGDVLLHLMERLDAMRGHLGDQVFDVVSTLISDVDLTQVLTQVALAPPAQASQAEALAEIIAATQAGEDRLRQWQEHPFAIDPAQFRQMRALSRELRLTPEYAQHFLVDTLEQLKETPQTMPGEAAAPGDAAKVQVTVLHQSVAGALGVRVGETLRVSFRPEACGGQPNVRLAALGTPLVDSSIQLAEQAWGHTRLQGATFLDPSLAPGEAYLLWFIAAQVLDGHGELAGHRLFAARQTPEGLAAAPSSALIDLMPEAGPAVVPPALLALASDPEVVLHWSVQHQHMPWLSEVQAARAHITGLRREPMLADAQAAYLQADKAYQDIVFGGEEGAAEAGRQAELAEQRLRALSLQFEREAACSLGAPVIVAVAAVVPCAEPPTEDMADTRPDVAAAAQRFARAYEEAHGRAVKDVSGEHRDYPYDLYSTGPGGVRCIEVKGTTTGRLVLSENERRAAQRLGPSYYLYVVQDPLGAPALAILRDPLSHMSHDSTLYSRVRYVYEAHTWQAAPHEETA